MSFRELPFLDVFKDATGGNIKTPKREFLEEGRFPVVDQGQVLIAGFVNDRSRVCSVNPPVIVFGDHTRAIKYVDFEFAMGADGTKVLVPKVESDAKYLYYALRAIQIPSAGYSRHYKFLKETKIPFPPIASQKRIAGILDAADALRAKRREAIAQIDTFLQAVFLDMFGDPVTNPKAWERKPLGEVIRVRSGDGLASKDMAADGEYPVYGGNGISGYHDSFMFEEPRIVLGRVGVYCGAVHLTSPRSWVTDNALYVHIFIQPVDTIYLVAALKMANLNQYAGRSAQPLISGNRIYPVEILVPPLDLQHRFAAIVESVEQLRARQRAHLAELDTLFASLQSCAFRGDL